MNDTPPEITTVLFIGGVLDRRRRQDKNLKYWKMAEPEPCPTVSFDFSKPAKTNLREDIYRRETLKSGETTWVVYVLDSMTVTQAMDALIKGYYLHEPEQVHLQCLDTRAQRDKAEAELANERALADQLAAIVQRSRDGHGGMLTDPECFCEDCEHLRVLDAALDRWKDARKPIDKTRDLERRLTIARETLTMIIDTSPSLQHAERMADEALKQTAPNP